MHSEGSLSLMHQNRSGPTEVLISWVHAKNWGWMNKTWIWTCTCKSRNVVLIPFSSDPESPLVLTPAIIFRQQWKQVEQTWLEGSLYWLDEGFSSGKEQMVYGCGGKSIPWCRLTHREGEAEKMHPRFFSGRLQSTEFSSFSSKLW